MPVSANDTPPRVWWSASWPGLVIAHRHGSCFDVASIGNTGADVTGELGDLPDDAVELRAVPEGREDMCSQMGCGLDRGSVVNELSRLLRGMARRVGEFRETASVLADPDTMDAVQQGQQGDVGTGVDLRSLATPPVPVSVSPDGQCEHEVQARGLRLTVAAQARQLGVLETVRLSSDRLIEDLRRKVPAAVLPRRGDAVEAWIKSERDQWVRGVALWNLLDDLLDDYRLHADTGTPLSEQAADGGYGAAALSGEAETDAAPASEGTT